MRNVTKPPKGPFMTYRLLKNGTLEERGVWEHAGHLMAILALEELSAEAKLVLVELYALNRLDEIPVFRAENLSAE